jgi:cell division protein FtsI (penicillin-binding protein 3)
MKKRSSKHAVVKKNTLLMPMASWRFYGVLGLLAVIAIIVAGRVASLQVIGGVDRGYEFLQEQGHDRTLRQEVIPAHRGMITDRQGEPLAVSTPVTTVWGNPQQMLEDKSQWPELARALRIPYGELKQKMHDFRNKGFVYLRRHMTPEKAQAVFDLGVKGVYGKSEYRRFYPAGEVAAHLVGFTNIDDKGLEGLELAYDEWLRGASGTKQVLKDRHGRIIRDVKSIRQAQPGKNLALSIDLRVQYLAHTELKTAVKRHRARAGSVVVIDTHTGEILAMANHPSYNPNNRDRLNPEAIRNRAITDLFEPGSTMKPLTTVAALESGKYTPDSKVDTNPGHFRVGRKTVLDPVNYGVIDLTKIITKSSQVGMSKVALSLDEQDVRNVFFRMGLGQGTASGFPGESTGMLPNYTHWKPIERATFAYGYGLSVTTLQLAQAYAIFANHGIKRSISLLRQDEQAEGQQVIDQKVADNILAMLRTVTEKGGTATRAQVAAYSVAGKSGTSHKAARGGYEDSQYVSIFAGMAPASNPRIVTVVMVDEPKGNEYYGGEVAAPVFSKIAEGALRLLNVAPDKLEVIADKGHSAAKRA